MTVVDDSGYPVLVSRLDEATPASVKTAIEKARSAVLYGIPTRVLEELVSERPALGGLDRVAVEEACRYYSADSEPEVLVSRGFARIKTLSLRNRL